MPRRPRGYTYLGVLLLMALLGALLAGLGQRASLAAQRERERELLFRGDQIRQAIESYRRAGPEPAWPASLQDLLSDRRGPGVRHHLRRLYADPTTGRADWVLMVALPEQGGGIRGVRSRHGRRRLLQGAGPEGSGPLLSDWQFVASETTAAATPPDGTPPP